MATNWAEEIDAELDTAPQDEGVLSDASTNKENEPDAKRPRGRPPRPKEEMTAADFKKILKQKDSEIAKLKKDHDSLQGTTDALREADQTTHAELIRQQGTIANLQKILNAKDEELQLLHEDHDAKVKEIKDLKDRLKQKQLDYEDILEQLDSMESSDLSTSVKKLHALFIADNITAPIANHLPEKFVWTVKRVSLKEVTTELLEPFDLVLFASGSVEMLQNTSWSDKLSFAKNAVKIAQEASCLPILLKLPPATCRPLSGKVSLFNHRLSKIEDTMTLSPEIENMNKSSFLQSDGLSLSTTGAKMYYDLIAEKLTSICDSDMLKSLPKCSNKASDMDTDDCDLKIIVEVDKDRMGRVIGKGGHNLKSITANNNVSISVGYWCEKDRGKEDLRQIFGGMLISGEMSNARKAKANIQKIAAESS
jgi:hypothetical protein